MERIKFFSIVSSNLDEFFEVRVAGLKQQIESEVVKRSIDGRTATETFRAITKRVRQMIDLQYRCWRDELLPALARNDIRFLTWDRSTRRTAIFLRITTTAECVTSEKCATPTPSGPAWTWWVQEPSGMDGRIAAALGRFSFVSEPS